MLEEAGVAVSELALRRPTLDDVFLTLTGHAAERGRGGSMTSDHRLPSARRTPSGGLRWAVSDALVLTGRNLRHTTRQPELLFFSTVQPVMFVLLFRYVFGGAIATPGRRLRRLPDARDLRPDDGLRARRARRRARRRPAKGIVDRFRSLPMARSAVLAGRTLADLAPTSCCVVLVMIVVGLAVGCAPASFLGLLGAIAPDVAVRLRLLLDLRLHRAVGPERRGGATSPASSGCSR